MAILTFSCFEVKALLLQGSRKIIHVYPEKKRLPTQSVAEFQLRRFKRGH